MIDRKLEAFYLTHKIPLEKMIAVFRMKHGLKPWQVIQAAQEVWMDVSLGKLPCSSVRIGWFVLLRAREMQVKREEIGLEDVRKLKEKISDLQEMLAWERRSWYNKLTWRMHNQ